MMISMAADVREHYMAHAMWETLGFVQTSSLYKDVYVIIMLDIHQHKHAV